MNRGAALWLVLSAVALCAPAAAIDLRERSESGSKQFIVYSDDVRLRQRVASFAETVKADVLKVLDESDLWKAPVVLTFAPATKQDRGEPLTRLRMAETEPGFKIEIQVKIGDDPAAVHLHKLLVRAVLLEYAYRETGIRAGQAIVEPPWWVVEGLYEMGRQREQGPDSTLFRQLVETNKLPPIENFLASRPDELGPTALAVDRALALCLLEFLIRQPGGRADLARLLRDWPQSDGNPAALLARNFPALGGEETLQKWWTLSLARFASADRYQGLTVAETEKALVPLLQLEIVINKAGEKKTFGLDDFGQFLKLADSRVALREREGELLALSTRANALYRPVMADYGEIFSQLSRGKTWGVKSRLARLEAERRSLQQRAAQIADYLNWFEATQMSSRSGLFDNYLKTASELDEQDRKRDGPIARYLDALEAEF